MDAPGCLGAFQFLRNELQAGTCRLIALYCHVATCRPCHHEAPQLQLHAWHPLPRRSSGAVKNKQMGTSEAATQRLRLDWWAVSSGIALLESLRYLWCISRLISCSWEWAKGKGISWASCASAFVLHQSHVQLQLQIHFSFTPWLYLEARRVCVAQLHIWSTMCRLIGDGCGRPFIINLGRESHTWKCNAFQELEQNHSAALESPPDIPRAAHTHLDHRRSQSYFDWIIKNWN